MIPQQKTIYISLGDPLGIGAEVTLKALAKIRAPHIRFCVVGHSHHKRLVPKLTHILNENHISWLPVNTPSNVNPHIEAGSIALDCLSTCLSHITDFKTQALVTAPLSKKNIQLAGSSFKGHTDLLCHHYGVTNHAMMLFSSKLRVVLLTIHEPLSQIFKSITQDNIMSKLHLTAQTLTSHFGIDKPRIAVCGLNPHAGEEGCIGDEEINIIGPAIEKCRNHPDLVNTTFLGPLPADSIFTPQRLKSYDAILCHYHDQGLIPLKALDFDSAVNMTLGLPLIRTSPDHGTAFDIAGQMMASEQSMYCAIQSAIQFLGKTL